MSWRCSAPMNSFHAPSAAAQNAPCGLIPVLKPAGMTSHDVVVALRRSLGLKRIGHTGTLDPMVTGVLPVLVGNATRMSDYFMNMPKTYRATAALGCETDTQDATGRVTASSSAFSVPAALLSKTLQSFCGCIRQIPPDYSAVKQGGKKLLDYVLEGRTAPPKQPRTVRVYRVELLDYREDEGVYDFEITCSKGTYVRTICHDIGRALGVYGHMRALTRTSSGGFQLCEAIPPEKVTQDSVLPLDRAVLRLANMDRWILPNRPDIVHRLLNGIRFHLAEEGRCIRKNFEVEGGCCPKMSEDSLVFVGDEFYGIADERLVLTKLIRRQP